MKESVLQPAGPAVRALGLALLVVCLLLGLVDPTLPKAGLDPSWQFAVEYAANHHLVFGRDFIFTYGPYHYLDTHFFDPATYPLVLVYEALATVAAFWVALANRSATALIAIGAGLALPMLMQDAVNALGLFAAFTICLRRRDPWSVIVAALCAPVALAKYSFVLVILPLLLLADLDRAWARRAPVLTLAFLAAVLLADAVAGQPLSAVGELVRNSLEIILGYGRAMQSTGPVPELVGTVVLGAAAAAFVTILAWPQCDEADEAGRRDLRPLVCAAGFAWTLFVLFKMGFVRQDTHPLIFHEAAPVALAVAYAFLDRPGRIRLAGRAAVLTIFVLMVAWRLHWRAIEAPFSPQTQLTVTQQLARAVRSGPKRLTDGLGWVSGQRFKPATALREARIAGLRRDFGAAVRGRVDVIPYDQAPLIASGLDYDPRPVIQSYSSYTPALQALDRAHFQGPKAPDALLLRVDDIDMRLPTLALGPSLPVIGQRYDAVGADPLGLVLRRRAAPRPMAARLGPVQALALDRWTPVPGAPGRLVMAHIKVERTLAGRLVGFLYREPLMKIELRTASGGVAGYRFIPDMAQLGVAVSPLPKSWDQVAALPLLDPQFTRPAEPVTAIRLSTSGKNWAFGRISVAYEEISLAPGFARQMPPIVEGSVQLAALMQRLGLPLSGAGAEPPAFHGPTAPADPALCRGWFDLLRPAPDAFSLWQAAGWGWDAADGHAFDHVLLVDDAGRLVGVGVGGAMRPDVPLAQPQVRSDATGWQGVSLRRSGTSVTAYGVLKDGRACPLGRKDWP